MLYRVKLRQGGIGLRWSDNSVNASEKMIDPMFFVGHDKLLVVDVVGDCTSYSAAPGVFAKSQATIVILLQYMSIHHFFATGCTAKTQRAVAHKQLQQRGFPAALGEEVGPVDGRSRLSVSQGRSKYSSGSKGAGCESACKCSILSHVCFRKLIEISALTESQNRKVHWKAGTHFNSTSRKSKP